MYTKLFNVSIGENEKKALAYVLLKSVSEIMDKGALQHLNFVVGKFPVKDSKETQILGNDITITITKTKAGTRTEFSINLIAPNYCVCIPTLGLSDFNGLYAFFYAKDTYNEYVQGLLSDIRFF